LKAESEARTLQRFAARLLKLQYKRRTVSAVVIVGADESCFLRELDEIVTAGETARPKTCVLAHVAGGRPGKLAPFEHCGYAERVITAQETD